MPKVSVITTVKNCEKYIQHSLNSIYQQTYKDYEIVIVNDGSDDKTLEKISEFVDRNKFEKYIIINQKDNLRIPKSRNRAIEVSAGEYIAIQDGDDFSFPNRLERQVNYLDQQVNIFGVGSFAEKIDVNGEVIGVMDYPPVAHLEIANCLIDKKMLNPMIDPSMMFRKDVFLELGRYSEEVSIYLTPDLDLWCRAVLASRYLANIPEKLIQYRVNPNGMTNKYKTQMILSHKKVMDKYNKSIAIKMSLRKVI